MQTLTRSTHLQIYDLVWWTPLILRLLIFILKVIEELQTTPVNNEEKELLQLLSTPHLRVKNTPETLTKFLCRIPIERFVMEKLHWRLPKGKENPPTNCSSIPLISCTGFRMQRGLRRHRLGLSCIMHHVVLPPPP